MSPLHAPKTLTTCLGVCLAVLITTAACSTTRAQPTSTAVAPALPERAEPTDYRIRPLDRLNITVFQVEALSAQKLQVDQAGAITLPLVGTLTAKGKTTQELGDEIRSRLVRYLQAPSVSVSVDEMAPVKVTVEGAVIEAGVYEMSGRTTLLEVVARAKGPTRTANPRRVAIIREVDGQRVAGIFDLVAIREGRAPDPRIQEFDVVVVDDSRTLQIWREVVAGLPVLAVFRWF